MKLLLIVVLFGFGQNLYGNDVAAERVECGVVKGLKAWTLSDPGQIVFLDRTVNIDKGVGSGGFFESVLAGSMTNQFRICVTLRPKTSGGEYIYKVERE